MQQISAPMTIELGICRNIGETTCNLLCKDHECKDHECIRKNHLFSIRTSEIHCLEEILNLGKIDIYTGWVKRDKYRS